MNPSHFKPVNRTAARVLSRGESHNYTPLESHVISDSPLPMAPPPTAGRQFKDLTGAVFGRLTVVGYSATHAGRWVCRCTCGKYVMRSSKAVKNGRGAMCEFCSLLQQAKRRDYFNRTGKYVNLDEFKW